MTSKKKKFYKEIETELECTASASLQEQVEEEIPTEDKSMASFMKELEELGEDGEK